MCQVDARLTSTDENDHWADKHGTYELNRVKGHPGKINWGQKGKFATWSGSGSDVGGKVHAKKERNYRTNAELEKIWSEFLQINPSFL